MHMTKGLYIAVHCHFDSAVRQHRFNADTNIVNVSDVGFREGLDPETTVRN